MSLLEEVERALRDGHAPAGYVVREQADGPGVLVEYPDDKEVMVGWPVDPGSWRSWKLSPGSEINDCGAILEMAGYAVELVAARTHHLLIVQGRRTLM
jgi:hypothetical protein